MDAWGGRWGENAHSRPARLDVDESVRRPTNPRDGDERCCSHRLSSISSGPSVGSRRRWEPWEVGPSWELSALVSHRVATGFDQLS